MKKSLLALVLCTTPVFAFADNGPGCGPGAQMWKGKSGLVAHTSAGTTNGTFSSPLSGILSGTSGCDNPGMVSNEFQKKIFVAMNMDDLAQDIAQGNGDHLQSLATLLGIEAQDKAAFYTLSQKNYGRIIASADTSYDSFLVALNEVLRSDEQLGHYVQ